MGINMFSVIDVAFQAQSSIEETSQKDRLLSAKKNSYILKTPTPCKYKSHHRRPRTNPQAISGFLGAGFSISAIISSRRPTADGSIVGVCVESR